MMYAWWPENACLAFPLSTDKLAFKKTLVRLFFLFSWWSIKFCSSSCIVPTCIVPSCIVPTCIVPTCTVPSKWQASPMSYKDTLQPVMTGNLWTQKPLFWPKLAFPNCSIDISIQLWTKRVLIEARWAKLLLLSKRSHDDSFSTRQGSRWSKTEPVSSSSFLFRVQVELQVFYIINWTSIYLDFLQHLGPEAYL